ncbi:MAG: nucleotide exchange factor GrpE [Anaerolineae bacterium]|nr:nucleotide exchange factor GrpE [Anaerolineae bacterium]
MIDEQVIAEFEKEIVDARRKADEAHDKYLRALADAENARKRAERQAEMRYDEQRRQFLLRFVPVVDNLERALQHADANDGLRAGVEMTYREMLRALSDNGVLREEPVGEVFDPARHEAVEAVKTDAPAGTILAVLQPGYRYGEQLIRPARVRVAV